MVSEAKDMFGLPISVGDEVVLAQHRLSIGVTKSVSGDGRYVSIYVGGGVNVCRGAERLINKPLLMEALFEKFPEYMYRWEIGMTKFEDTFGLPISVGDDVVCFEYGDAETLVVTELCKDDGYVFTGGVYRETKKLINKTMVVEALTDKFPEYMV